MELLSCTAGCSVLCASHSLQHDDKISSPRKGQVITTLLSSAIAPCTVVMNTKALNSSLRLSQQERTNENRCWVGPSCLPTPSPGPTSELKLIPEIPAKGTESQHCRSSLPPDHWGPTLGIWRSNSLLRILLWQGPKSPENSGDAKIGWHRPCLALPGAYPIRPF